MTLTQSLVPLRTFANIVLEAVGLFNKVTGRGKTKIQILRDFEGLVKSGEMLVVLGRPGSGCSTLLKTMSGETHGFYIDSKSHINYQGMIGLLLGVEISANINVQVSREYSPGGPF